MQALLHETEKPVFGEHNIDGHSSIFLTCDHASNHIPEQLAGLGLSETLLHRHIGWDIGALDVSKALSDNLDAPLVYTKFSRLVIDCNRPPFEISSIPEEIHGIPVPGNKDLSEEAVRQRIEDIFMPYHQAIDKALSFHKRMKKHIFLFAVHSYTPVLKGIARPWPIGITFEYPSAFSTFLLRELRSFDVHPIGENEPYPVTPEGDYGLFRHGNNKGIDSVLLEIRQDYLEHDDTKNSIIHMLTTVLEKFEKTVGHVE